MKLEMNKNSIFALLLRSPWWASGGIAAVLFASLRLALPAEYAVYAFFVALPFLVISLVVAWRQLRAPSETAVAGSLAALRAMPWKEFSAAVESAFRGEGYGVQALDLAGADFELHKAGRRTLVACKRWKAALTGIEPLRELEAQRRHRDVQDCIYLTAGALSEQALRFCSEKNIRILRDAELVKFMPPAGPKKANPAS